MRSAITAHSGSRREGSLLDLLINQLAPGSSMAVTSRSSRNAAFDLWRNEKALSAFANAMAAPAPSRFRAECQMEKVLLELKLTRARSETVMRWIAMGIAVLPEHLRDEEYGR